MGCYGIGVTRMAAAWVEQNHDDKGIICHTKSPVPGPPHALNVEDTTVSQQAEQIYQQLQQQGVNALRRPPLRAGEKFGTQTWLVFPSA